MVACSDAREDNDTRGTISGGTVNLVKQGKQGRSGDLLKTQQAVQTDNDVAADANAYTRRARRGLGSSRDVRTTRSPGTSGRRRDSRLAVGSKGGTRCSHSLS